MGRDYSKNSQYILIKKTIDYNTKYGVNFNELCIIFEISKDELNKILTSPEVKYLDENNLIQIENILETKGEKVDKIKTTIASIEYQKEKKLLINISEIKKKKQQNKNYRLTDEDIKNIAMYRVSNQLSIKNISDLLNIDQSTISRREMKVTEGILKNQLDDLNQYNNSHCDIGKTK